MILYPAIDLKDGHCVRLLKGEMDKATVFSDSPAAQARSFQDAGCDWIHLVDLNGAFAGEPVNAAAVEAILAEITVPAQLGGGIRDMATIERWLSKGISRVILGTVAVENPDLVRDAARAFPGKVAVGLDARNGFVATRGWATETELQVTDLARAFEDAGIAAIIYTDINRDGAMQGPNIEATAALAITATPSRRPPVEAPAVRGSAPGSCTAWVASMVTGQPSACICGIASMSTIRLL